MVITVAVMAEGRDEEEGQLVISTFRTRDTKDLRNDGSRAIWKKGNFGRHCNMTWRATGLHGERNESKKGSCTLDPAPTSGFLSF